MRVVACPILWRADTDEREKFDCTLPGLAPAETEVLAQRLHQLIADCENRIERRHRVLENETNLAATNLRISCGAKRQQIPIPETDLS